MRRDATRGAWLVCLVLVALSVSAQETKDRVAVQRQVRSAPSNILVMFSDSKQPQDLPVNDKAPLPRVTPALSPDGRTLAFAAKVGDFYKLFTWELDAQNLPVGEPTQVTTNAETTDKFPAWSPDGKRLAYLATDAGNKTTLRLINSDGTGMLILPEVRYSATPTWRGDGQAVLYIDMEANSPTLKNVMTAGNMPLPIRPGTKIIAASQAPATAKDTVSIAVLVQNANGLCDLCIIKPFGTETKKLVSQIAGAKSVNWVSADTIIFNATKVGTQADKALWLVNPDGGKPRGLNAFTDPKQIAYVAMHKADLAERLPNPVDPAAPTGPNGGKPTDPVPTGPVTIMRPYADTTVRGTVSVKIFTQPKTVTSVVLRINNQFLFAASPQADEAEPAPYVLFTWNTQQFIDIDPTIVELDNVKRAQKGKGPLKYVDLQRFPDGAYTVSVQALDGENKMVGQNEIKVTVQNGLPDKDFPVENTVLKYKGADDVFSLRGEAVMFGANPGQAPEMNASLDLTVRRTLIDSRAAGYDMRTEIREPQSGYSLSFGLKEATIPEASASALYTFSQDGTVRMIEQLREKIYLPVSAFSTPLPTFPVTRETTWPKAMNVVVDLLNRDNTMAQASHAIDGLEWVNGRRTIRIRSEYKLDPRWTPYPLLALKPTRTPPEERVTRGELLKKATQPVAVGGYPGAAQPVGGATDAGNGLKFDDCVGIRYSWYDYQANALLRVDDFVLYSFPTTNLPSATGGDGTGQPGMGDPAMGNPGMGNPPPPGDTPPPLGAPGNNPFGGGGGVTKPTKPANAPKVGTAYYLVRLSYLTKTEE